MPHHRKNIFLTLVVLILYAPLHSFGIPNSDMPPDKIDTQLSKPNNDEGDTPLIPTRKLTRALSFSGGGVWSGYTANANTNDSVFFFTYGIRLNDELESSSELSAKILMNSVAGWFYGKKWLYELGHMQEPYYKLGVGSLYSFSENFGTFMFFNRYYVSGSIGFDDLFRLDRHLRTDLGISLSALGPGFYIGLEYAF